MLKTGDGHSVAPVNYRFGCSTFRPSILAWRGTCRSPRNVACQLPSAHPSVTARHAPPKRNQQVVESELRTNIDP